SGKHAADLPRAGPAGRPAQPVAAPEVCMKPLARYALPLLLLVAVIASFIYLQLEASALLSREGAAQMAEYAVAFFSPDLSTPHLRAIAYGALETLAMSAIGTLLAAALGLMLALPAAGRFGRVTKVASRFLLNALRAIPELVWAALMVLAAGLGP